jgi:hypothetical protein
MWAHNMLFNMSAQSGRPRYLQLALEGRALPAAACLYAACLYALAGASSPATWGHFGALLSASAGLRVMLLDIAGMCALTPWLVLHDAAMRHAPAAAAPLPVRALLVTAMALTPGIGCATYLLTRPVTGFHQQYGRGGRRHLQNPWWLHTLQTFRFWRANGSSSGTAVTGSSRSNFRQLPANAAAAAVSAVPVVVVVQVAALAHAAAAAALRLGSMAAARVCSLLVGCWQRLTAATQHQAHRCAALMQYGRRRQLGSPISSGGVHHCRVEHLGPPPLQQLAFAEDYDEDDAVCTSSGGGSSGGGSSGGGRSVRDSDSDNTSSSGDSSGPLLTESDGDGGVFEAAAPGGHGVEEPATAEDEITAAGT